MQSSKSTNKFWHCKKFPDFHKLCKEILYRGKKQPKRGAPYLEPVKETIREHNKFWSWNPWDWGIVKLPTCEGFEAVIPVIKKMKEKEMTDELAALYKKKIAQFFIDLDKEDGVIVTSVKLDWLEHMKNDCQHDMYILTDLDVEIKLKG